MALFAAMRRPGVSCSSRSKLRVERPTMRAVPPADLRQSERIPATIPISLLVESERFKVEHSASTINLSVGGLRVRAPLALVPGETVGIITQGDSRHALSTRVVWAQRVGTNHGFLSGLAFLETLPA